MTKPTLGNCDAGDVVEVNFPKFIKDDWGERHWFDCVEQKQVAMVVTAPRGRVVVFQDAACDGVGAEIIRDFMEQHRDD